VGGYFASGSIVLPARVQEAVDRASRVGFAMSSDPEVGQLLAVLAASTPRNGRILELGTGCGVGLAWITYGLGARVDVDVVSVERDRDVAALTRDAEWPAFVNIIVGDAVGLLGGLGGFDLIFADSEGGKWDGLEVTLAALRPGGHIIVDDMLPPEWQSSTHRIKTIEARVRLTTDPSLVAVELAWATGVILCTKRHS
jgi:demethylmenaquinone methyltransferase/2-methoxy-6-polyprenyl-1,4-benzoquinol methylase